MKKQFLLIAMAMVVSIGSLFAQGGGGQRMTPEERAKSAMEKIAALNLNADQTSKTNVIITDFYTTSQKAMEEMRASGSVDREAFMAKREELSKARDNKLKEVFTADQFKKWTDEVEPSLRPQRGGGQRSGN
jgi:periplasmic protein CpxP/Spy